MNTVKIAILSLALAFLVSISLVGTSQASTITGFSPMAALAGASVVITGTGFVPGSTTVLFNGTSATVTSSSATQLIATVPNATSGVISVTASGSPTVSSGTFTVLPGGTTTSATVSGTVTYSGSKSGRIYLSASNQNNNSTIGVSIPAKGAFIITGLNPGTYLINGFIDTSATGMRHANDPYTPSDITPVNVTIASQSQSVTGVTVNLIDRSPAVAIAAPTNFGAARASDSTGTFLKWDPSNVSGAIIPSTNTISWSLNLSGTPVVGSRTIAATDNGMWFHSTLTTYYYQVTANLDATSASTGWVQAQSLGGAGQSISGTVTYNSITPTGPLYLAAVPGNGTPILIAIAAPAVGSSSFTIPNVPAGTYGIYGFLDMNNNGIDDDGDYRLMDNNGIPVTVTSGNVTGVVVPLPTTDVSFTSSTSHDFYGEPGSSNSGENFSYQFNISPQKKTPVNAEIISVAGASTSVPIDMGDVRGKGTFRLSVSNVAAKAGDTYTVRVQYSDASTADIPVITQAPLMSPPIPLSPLYGVQFPGSGNAVFNWSAPLTPPVVPFNYYLSLRDNNGQNQYFEADLPSTATNYDSGSGGNTSPIPDAFGRYNWSLSLNDFSGNWVSYQAGFSTAKTAPVITGFTPATANPGGTMIINGYNFGVISTVSLGGFTLPIFAQNGTQLTVGIPAGVTGSNQLSLNYSGGATIWSDNFGNAFTVPTGAPASLAITVLASATGNPISGATVALVSNPAVTATTDGSGAATLAGLPGNISCRLRITAAGYQPLYTMDTTITGSISVKLFTAAEITSRGISAGKGAVLSSIKDSSNGLSISGATATVTSQKGITYSVSYYNILTNNFDGSQTDSSGAFLVRDVDHGDLLSVSAVKSGYTFTSSQHMGVVESITNGLILGTVAAPTITSFNPTSGKVGVTVTITGTNLSTVSAATINGVSAAVTLIDSTHVSIIVPPTAATGTITITTPGGTAPGGTFTVLPNTLTVNLSGTGSGSVNATSGATLTCTSPSASCIANVAYGTTPVTLSATASLGSALAGWSGACASIPCTFTMLGDQTATATFMLQQNIKNGTSYYGTLQSALSAVIDGETLKMQTMTLPDSGTVTFSRSSVTATLKGGYEGTFTTQSGATTLNGILSLGQGTAIVDYLIIY